MKKILIILLTSFFSCFIQAQDTLKYDLLSKCRFNDQKLKKNIGKTFVVNASVFDVHDNQILASLFENKYENIVIKCNKSFDLSEMSSKNRTFLVKLIELRAGIGMFYFQLIKIY